MADQSISQLPVATTLTGIELVPIVQNGITKQTQVNALANAISPGKLITSAGLAGSNILFQYNDGTTSTAGPVVATVTIGSTTTLDAGSSATVTNIGTSSSAIFSFGIPTGPTGPTGATGPQGPTGATGAGVPFGGFTNQVLMKASNASYDTYWAPISGPTAATLSIDSNNNPIGIINPKNNLPIGNLQEFVPLTNDYAGILAAYNAAVSAGGGTVKLRPVTYEIGANTLPIITGVSYIGTMPTLSNLWGDAPDIGAIQKGGTIINGTGIAMAAATTEGAQFNGSITNGVLTVSAINLNPTGNYGKIITGAIILGTGVPAGDNLYPFIVAQLTSTAPGGALGGAGTYSLTTTKGPINTTLNVSAFTDGKVWAQSTGNLSPDGITIQDICFTNVTTAISVGAFNSVGFSFSKLINLYCFNSTGRAFSILNYEHIEVDGIYAFNCADSMTFSMYASTGLSGYGNSKITKIYTQSNGNIPNATYGYPKGLEFGAVLNSPGDGVGSIELNVIQNNHYGRTPTSATFTFNGTANISVPNAALWPVGMPVRFGTGDNNGIVTYNPTKGNTANGVISGGVTYFVTSSNTSTNIIQIAISQRDTPITPTAGTLAAVHYGYPAISFRGALTSASCINSTSIDMEGPGTMFLWDGLAGCNIAQNYIGHVQGESLVIRNSVNTNVFFGNSMYVDSQASTSNIKWFGGVKYDLSATGGGNTIGGLFVDQDNSGVNTLNLAGDCGSNVATGKSFYNRSPGNADWTYPGRPLGVTQGYNPGDYPFGNTGAPIAGFGVYTAAGNGSWGWGANITSGNGPNMKGFRQTFKNGSPVSGGGNLTITLASNDGTFDGITGVGGSYTSSGKSIVLSPPTATTCGGTLTIVCCQTGASTYAWMIESLINGALV